MKRRGGRRKRGGRKRKRVVAFGGPVTPNKLV
jgi:hypothetical protein